MSDAPADLETSISVAVPRLLVEIPLTKGYTAIIDAEDYDLVREYKWRSHVNVRKTGDTVYVVTQIRRDGGKQRFFYMHRLIVGAKKGEYVDHKNHNGLDNRRSNLRICTNQDNIRHSRKTPGTTSRYKGVCWAKEKRKWRVRIRAYGENMHLGYFDSEEEAGLAYDKAARKYFGAFHVENL